MKDHDLDRIIDAAAGQMVSQEPPQELTSAVMARVRVIEDGARPRRFVWATVGVSAAACAVIAVLMLNSASQPVVESPRSAASTTVTTESTAAAPVQPDSTVANAGSTAESSETRPSRVRRVTRREGPASLAHREFEALAGSVAFESISLLPIDLPGLAMTSTQVDEIVIEPITIESLSASND
jgi:hypothetical protein